MDPGFAPAKVNLCLHITGRRPDGYHLLDSLAVFAGVGDTLTAEPADALSLTIAGPFAPALQSEADNLVLRAARALAATIGRPAAAHLHLEKNLPLASGIGGGSSDAAATLRQLALLWRTDIELAPVALQLGADVPVCLACRPARMRGIGELLEPCELPDFGLLLANPGVKVATAEVFARRAAGASSYSAPLPVLPLTDTDTLAEFLRHTTNDLQQPAEDICPRISETLAAVASTSGCLLARMSGSGATCFGVFRTTQAATNAAITLRNTGWWLWAGAPVKGSGAPGPSGVQGQSP